MDVENIEGQYNNARYSSELENYIINDMKLFPCWSAVMISICKENKVAVSSVKVEINFNQLKNRLFKSESMLILVDEFINKILP